MQEINLYDLLKYYARNWLILLSAVFVGAIIGLAYTFFIQTPLYKSEATVLIVGERTTQDSAIINNNYLELFKSRRVLEPVIEKQTYDGDYNQLLKLSTATNAKETDVIRVSIADTNAEKSEQLLSASLGTFKKEASSLYGSNNIKIVDAASLPKTAYNVSFPLQLGLSIIAILAITIVILFFVYDYYTSQIAPSNKSDTTKKKKVKKPVNKNKRTSKVVSPKSTSKLRSFLSVFYKKPILVIPTSTKRSAVAK